MDRGPAYRIDTERLVLRCYSVDDHAAVSAGVLANLEHLRRSMPWVTGEPLSTDERVARLRQFRGAFDLGQDFPYGVFDREGAFIGSAGLHPRIGPGAIEIGYWIDRGHEGRGLVTEAAGALTRAAIELHGVERVEIRCDPENARSAAVARRLGYTQDATLRRRARRPDGTERGTMIWSLFADELGSSPAVRIAYEARDAVGRRIDAEQQPGHP